MKIPSLSRRERQIMDVLYRLESATAAEVLDQLAEQTNYSTIRAQLRGLEDKGHVRHIEQGPRYVYRPTVARKSARRSALRHIVETFFQGSVEQVVAALVSGEVEKLEPEELDRISEAIAAAKRRRP